MTKVIVSIGRSAYPKPGIACWIAHFGPFQTEELAQEWIKKIWHKLGTLQGLAYTVGVFADPYDYGKVVTTLVSTLVSKGGEITHFC